MMCPPYECPAMTIGPSMLSRTLRRYSASLARPRSGFATAITRWPASRRALIEPFQLEESAYAPWTRTMVCFTDPLVVEFMVMFLLVVACAASGTACSVISCNTSVPQYIAYCGNRQRSITQRAATGHHLRAIYRCAHS